MLPQKQVKKGPKQRENAGQSGITGLKHGAWGSVGLGVGPSVGPRAGPRVGPRVGIRVCSIMQIAKRSKAAACFTWRSSQSLVMPSAIMMLSEGSGNKSRRRREDAWGNALLEAWANALREEWGNALLEAWSAELPLQKHALQHTACTS